MSITLGIVAGIVDPARLDDRVARVGIDRRAVAEIRYRVIATEGVGLADAGGDAFIDVGRREYVPDVVQTARAVGGVDYAIDLGLDLGVGDACRRILGRGALLGLRRVGLGVDYRVALAILDGVRAMGDAAGCRAPSELGLHGEDVAVGGGTGLSRRSRAGVPDVGEVLLDHAGVVVRRPWRPSLEGVCAAGPEDRVYGDPAGHRLATVVGEGRQRLRRALGRPEPAVLERQCRKDPERGAYARVERRFGRRPRRG